MQKIRQKIEELQALIQELKEKEKTLYQNEDTMLHGLIDAFKAVLPFRPVAVELRMHN